MCFVPYLTKPYPTLWKCLPSKEILFILSSDGEIFLSLSSY
jgi:hypothetical protein